jgi:hypothetical protein
MALDLTWDLFVVVFFLVIVAYSFIIGKNQTMKVIISTYVAILAADGIGSIIEKYLVGTDPIIQIFTVDKIASALIVFKIAVFVFTIVLLSTRGGFDINLDEEKSTFLYLTMTTVYGILSAGLIVSTVLIYTSGVSMIEGTVDLTNTVIYPIYQTSFLVRQMINQSHTWFSLPAIALILSSFLNKS